MPLFSGLPAASGAVWLLLLLVSAPKAGVVRQDAAPIEPERFKSDPLPPLVPAPAPLPPLIKSKPGLFRVIALPDRFEAHGLNNKGEIVGTWDKEKAAVWVKGKLRVLPIVYTHINGPDDPPNGAGIAVNDAGVVGGSSGKLGSGAYTYEFRDAALWFTVKNKIVGHSIGYAPKYSNASVLALNNRGQAVGTAIPASPLERSEEARQDIDNSVDDSSGFFWDGRKLLDLGQGVACGMNARGQVVGRQNGKIVLWQGREKRILGDGFGYAINNWGQILASVPITRDEKWQDGLFRAALLYKGTVTRLGTLTTNKSSRARSLNDRGEIVGTSYRNILTESRNSRAFLWRAEKIYDLNQFIPARSGWTLEDAKSINNKGWIVGEGTWRGENRSFLLVPK